MEPGNHFKKAKSFLVNLRHLHKLDPDSAYLGYTLRDVEEKFEKIPVNILINIVKNYYGVVAINYIFLKLIVKR